MHLYVFLKDRNYRQPVKQGKFPSIRWFSVKNEIYLKIFVEKWPIKCGWILHNNRWIRLSTGIYINFREIFDLKQIPIHTKSHQFSFSSVIWFCFLLFPPFITILIDNSFWYCYDIMCGYFGFNLGAYFLVFIYEFIAF